MLVGERARLGRSRGWIAGGIARRGCRGLRSRGILDMSLSLRVSVWRLAGLQDLDGRRVG
jgi:hypothetical protein